MRRLRFVPWLLSLVFLLLLLPVVQSSFAQEDTVKESQTSESLSEKTLEAAQLLIGNFPQQSALSIDLSYLSPFDTERITVIEHGYLPSEKGPAAYWLIELENISQSYLKPMTVLNYLNIRQETEDGIRSFVEMRSELITMPNAQWAPAVDSQSLMMAPGAVWQIRLLTPTVDPFSQYALVNALMAEDINVGLPTTSDEERIIHLVMADPNFSPEDYDSLVETLKNDSLALKQKALEEHLIAFEETASQPLEKATLDQAITERLTLIEHGVEEITEPVQTRAYWIFEWISQPEDVNQDQNDGESSTTNESANYQYIAEDLWPFKGIQELAGMSSYDIPLDITLVEPTASGFYMPLTQPHYQAAAQGKQQMFFKLSFPITSPLYEHFLDYNGERFDIIGDWGAGSFN